MLNTANYAKLSPAQKKVMDDHCSSDCVVEDRHTLGRLTNSAGKAKLEALPGQEVYR